MPTIRHVQILIEPLGRDEVGSSRARVPLTYFGGYETLEATRLPHAPFVVPERLGQCYADLFAYLGIIGGPVVPPNQRIRVQRSLGNFANQPNFADQEW